MHPSSRSFSLTLHIFSRIHRIWQNTLPPSVVAELCSSSRIQVLDGDVCKKNFGLDQDSATSLQKTIKVVIHAASSINLEHNLAWLAPIIIQGTLNTAEFALGCKSLDRFVYISTAYANSYLHYLEPSTVPHISERIHSLRKGIDPYLDVEEEWLDLQESGTTPQYETTPFPFAYAYAKHLTERLLVNRFGTDDATSQRSGSSSASSSSARLSPIPPGPSNAPKLLIIRPSIIGPAESPPAPGWQIATSAPVTCLLAFFLLTPATRLTFYSALSRPNNDAIIDEVPVDIVFNRIIWHTAAGTSGIVHANRELALCHSFGTYVRSIQKLRRLPWDSRVVWEKDAASAKLCKISTLYQISGCTFDFDDSDTRSVWAAMTRKDRQAFPLFAAQKYGIVDGNRIDPDLSSRDEALRKLCAMYFERKQWPKWMLPLFYSM